MTANIHICQRCPERQQVCAGPCPCLLDGRDISDHAAAGDCPKGYYNEPEKMPPRVAPQPPSAELLALWNRPYRELWAEIHRRPRTTTDLTGEPDWLLGIAARLPCGECKSEWLSALKRTPPDLSSPEAYFAWTVNRHNDVNARIGKAIMPLEEARCLYGYCGCGANRPVPRAAPSTAE